MILPRPSYFSLQRLHFLQLKHTHTHAHSRTHANTHSDTTHADSQGLKIEFMVKKKQKRENNTDAKSREFSIRIRYPFNIDDQNFRMQAIRSIIFALRYLLYDTRLTRYELCNTFYAIRFTLRYVTSRFTIHTSVAPLRWKQRNK